MLRRLLAVSALVLAALLATGTAGAQAVHPSTPHPGTAASMGVTALSTSTTEALPGTTLEADSRDDGTSPAPWLIGSAIAAAAMVAIGGTLLKRRAG
jgi:hypothetical protein